jgi:putative transposase
MTIETELPAVKVKAKITIKLRLRDKHAAELTRQSRAVNYVWNFCNETQAKAANDRRKWLSNYDLQKLTAGAGTMLGISSQTVCKICETYEKSRRQKRLPKLRFRGRRSLGWVPFHANSIRFDGSSFIFRSARYDVMHTRSELQPGIRLCDGSFNCDARGRWYINVPIEVDVADQDFAQAVGVDLGLKTMATLSDGGKIEARPFYRKSEEALATSQRARKTKRALAIHAKAANRRKDFLHKASSALVKEYGTIIVGDVSPSRLAKTNMAKSVNDAGWASFKTMLSYKSIMNGGRFLEVSEAYTSQTCSTCGCLPASRPRGIAGLAIREWACDDCGSVNDRDVNAARNILRVGLDALVEGAA